MGRRGILLIGRSLRVSTGFVTFFQTMPGAIGRCALRACLMQRPHIFIHRVILFRTILAKVPQASDAATNLADHDGNANGNGKKHQGETLANVPQACQCSQISHDGSKAGSALVYQFGTERRQALSKRLRGRWGRLVKGGPCRRESRSATEAGFKQYKRKRNGFVSWRPHRSACSCRTSLQDLA